MMYKFGMCFFGISMSIIVVGSIALVHGSTFLPSMIYILPTSANKGIQKNK